MNLLQRLELLMNGRAYIGHRKRPGWKAALPFYVFRCPVHGLVEDYPHGYRERLDCPHCFRRSTHPELVEKVVEATI